MEDERKLYLDCLLADFSSLKEEIRRRSTLQRFVLVGFLIVLALTFKEATSGALTSSWIAGLWLSSFLALLFYFREDLEIGRLGIIIKECIAVSAARELRVGWTEIFHSETNQAVERIGPITAFYYTLFNWIVFLGLPALSPFCIVPDSDQTKSKIFPRRSIGSSPIQSRLLSVVSPVEFPSSSVFVPPCSPVQAPAGTVPFRAHPHNFTRASRPTVE